MELNAYWKERPQKNSPGAASTTPRYSTGQPSSPKTGSSIQSKTCLKPVHHTTVVASITRPSSSTGRPVADSGHPARSAVRPARLEVVPLDPQHRPAVVPDLVHLLAADGRPPGEHVRATRTTTTGNTKRDGPRDSQRNGIWPQSRPTRVVGRCSASLVRDVAARSGTRRRPAPGPGASWDGSPVLARVQLQDRRVEVGGEVRHVRRPAEGAGGDHHVVAGDGVLAARLAMNPPPAPWPRAGRRGCSSAPEGRSAARSFSR